MNAGAIVPRAERKILPREGNVLRKENKRGEVHRDFRSWAFVYLDICSEAGRDFAALGVAAVGRPALAAILVQQEVRALASIVGACPHIAAPSVSVRGVGGWVSIRRLSAEEQHMSAHRSAKCESAGDVRT